MKAKDFIDAVRQDTKELYDLHLLSISSNGEAGLRCINPEVLESKMNMTDKEILEKYLPMGAEIDDAEEYLSKLQK